MDFRSWSNFERIWGHLGGCFNFGLFGTVFGPQKVLLLGKFSRSTSRSRDQGHLIRDKFWSKIFFSGWHCYGTFPGVASISYAYKGIIETPAAALLESRPEKKFFTRHHRTP